MEKIEELLNQISKIVVEEKTQQKERRKRGENFNIFKVLGLSCSEVRLHSAFLAELLNPDGDHGLEDKFLKSFIAIVIGKNTNFDFDTTSARTYVEYDIGTISEDNKEGGRIDILILDKNGKAVIIENKIYAVDQPWQLYRYNRFAEKNYSTGNYILLYLTLDGHQPSEKSTGKNSDFTYFCISYYKDIMDWLDTCHRIATSHPNIRETIVQYIINLKQILNIMSEENRQKAIDYLIDNKNIEATLQIIELRSDIGRTIRKKFIEEKLKVLADKFNMDFEPNEKFLSLNNDGEQLKFKLKKYPDVYFAIQKYKSEGIYYSIYNSSGIIVRKDKFKDWTYEEEGDKDGKWPYGWKYFENSLKFWDDSDALLDMVTSDKIYIEIDKALNDITANKLIEELSADIDNNEK